MSSKRTLGERITRARLALGASQGRFISQAELGGMVGVTGATMGNYEAGRTEPSYAILEAIARALAVAPGDLAFGLPGEQAAQFKKEDKRPFQTPVKKRRKGNG